MGVHLYIDYSHFCCPSQRQLLDSTHSTYNLTAYSVREILPESPTTCHEIRRHILRGCEEKE
jgi:hypothetical protein